MKFRRQPNSDSSYPLNAPSQSDPERESKRLEEQIPSSFECERCGRDLSQKEVYGTFDGKPLCGPCSNVVEKAETESEQSETESVKKPVTCGKCGKSFVPDEYKKDSILHAKPVYFCNACLDKNESERVVNVERKERKEKSEDFDEMLEEQENQ
jgi:hypothetical protein